MKINPKSVTLQSLHNLKADVYARAKKRAQELSRADEDLDQIALKLRAVKARANHEASRIAYVIQLIKVRA